MEVVYARNTARYGVEELGRNGLGEWVVAFLFPPRHQVVTVLRNHSVELRNFVGTVLQVGIHRNHHVAAQCLKRRLEGGSFAVISVETNPANARITGR